MFEHLADADAAAAADIVGLTRSTPDGRRPVGSGDVPDIGEIADRVEIADGDYGSLETALDPGDLAGEGRGGKLGRTTGAGVRGTAAAGSSAARSRGGIERR